MRPHGHAVVPSIIECHAIWLRHQCVDLKSTAARSRQLCHSNTRLSMSSLTGGDLLAFALRSACSTSKGGHYEKWMVHLRLRHLYFCAFCIRGRTAKGGQLRLHCLLVRR